MTSSTPSTALSLNPSKDFKAPLISYIETIAQLLEWESRKDEATVSRVALAPRAALPSTAMPCMLGFDNGEFTYDEWFTLWSQGACGFDDKRTAANAYNFNFWQYADISYYYSHRLLAVPPTVWTNAAHKNGVLSLGTLGLNWTENWPSEGSPKNPKLFSQEQVADFLTKKPSNADPTKIYLEDAIELLDAIRLYYGFDGYLINLEDRFDDTHPAEQLRSNMLALLTALRERGCTMMWYDSPFSNGGGFAQYLNDKQYDFFTATGHFQTDYSWWGAANTMPSASWATLKAHESASDALVDRSKVFHGLYTSRFNTRTVPYTGNFFPLLKNLQSDGKGTNPPSFYTGFCLYYPAWTMYDMRTGVDPNKVLPTREQFQVTDQAFWTGTKDIIDWPKPGVNNVAPEQSMKHYLFERTVIKSLPFVTTFNDGEGDFYNIEGANYSEGPWNNLSDQSVLPSFRFTFDDKIYKANNTRLNHTQSDLVYTGGSCLHVDLTGITGDVRLDLFRTAVKLTSSTVIRLVVKGKPLASIVKPLLWILYGSVESLPAGKVTGLLNNWYQVEFSIPENLVGETVGKIQLEFTPGANTSIVIGQFSILDLGVHHREPWLQYFPGDSTELDWTTHVVDPASYYRVWGSADGLFQSVLLGVVYNSVYRAAYNSDAGFVPGTNIFNTKYKSFSKYTVQEVDSTGASTPFGR